MKNAIFSYKNNGRESGAMLLAELMNIQRGATAIIGGGGKTTMMYTLARELEKEHSVAVMTTTHIAVPRHIPTLLNPTEEDARLLIKKGRAVCIAKLGEEKKLCPSDVAAEKLCEMAEYVIIEADGSRGLPFKAHLDYEPVIPQCAKDTILVIGMSGMGKRVKEAAHRTEKYCQLGQCKAEDSITPETAARVANAEGLHTKAFLNQMDAAKAGQAEELARLLNTKVYGGAPMKGEWRCLC